jgi:cell filamentation protein
LPDPADEIERRLQANDDPYLDPTWGVLANKVGARTQQDLDTIEDNMVEARTVQLLRRPIAPTFDERHLRAIHRHLFHDIYSWAGQPRTVDTSKPGDSASFFPHQRFAFGAPATFEQLHARRFRRGMPRTEFVDKLTATYDEINHLHLFREGNGRAQRIFLHQLAEHAGCVIDWSGVGAQRNDHVCKAAGHGDLEPMRHMIDEIVRPHSHTPDDPDVAASRALLAASNPVRSPRPTAQHSSERGYRPPGAGQGPERELG